jgi:predicted phage-related endonuclease
MIDHELHRLGIGGSEAAALFGADEFKDAFTVWAQKKGGLPPEPPNVRMIVGKALERAVVDIYACMTGRAVDFCDKTQQHPTRPFQIYTPDALCVNERRGVEAKVVFWDQRNKWGWRADEIPYRVTIQAYWYMAAMDYDVWDVVALIGEGLPRIYEIRRDVEAEKVMLEKAEAWWRKYLVGDERPPIGNSEEAAQWLQLAYPTHKRPDMREATLEEAAILDEYVQLRLHLKRLTRKCDGMELQIIDAIKDKEGLTWPEGRFTWRKTRDREETDWHALAVTLMTKYVKDPNEQILLEELHTSTREGFRRIHINHPLLNRGAKLQEVTA